jgi:enoyl-CoA hydratase/carnithine racemase
MARTVGNTLSDDSLDLLVDRLGVAIAQRMLVAAETIEAADLAACGFVRVVDGDLDAEAAAVAASLATSATQTVRAAKAALQRRRAARLALLEPDDELLRQVYGHPDLKARVQRFLDR